MKPPLTKQQFCTAIDNIKDYWYKMREVEKCFGSSFSEGAIVNIVDNYVDTLFDYERFFLLSELLKKMYLG